MTHYLFPTFPGLNFHKKGEVTFDSLFLTTNGSTFLEIQLHEINMPLI